MRTKPKANKGVAGLHLRRPPTLKQPPQRAAKKAAEAKERLRPIDEGRDHIRRAPQADDARLRENPQGCGHDQRTRRPELAG